MKIPLAFPELRWQGQEILPEPWPGPSLGPTSQWFCIGSCFAERCAKALKQHLLRVHFAAGGALYTPEAIMRWLQLCRLAFSAGQEKFCAEAQDLIISQNARYLHPHAPGWLEASSRTALLQQLWQQCLCDCLFLCDSAAVIITLGSSFSFYSPAQDCYWSNGHRLPSAGLEAILQKVLLSPQHIDQVLVAINRLFTELNPKAQLVYSVSPIRHEPLTAVDNSLSKAQLLSAIHRLRRQDQWYYFPAYEIVMDELRDYRWYDHQRKQLHIDSFALLLRRLLEVAASEELGQFLAQVVVLAKMLRHRSSSNTSEHSEELLAQLRQKFSDLPKNTQDYRELLVANSLENYYY